MIHDTLLHYCITSIDSHRKMYPFIKKKLELEERKKNPKFASDMKVPFKSGSILRKIQIGRRHQWN